MKKLFAVLSVLALTVGCATVSKETPKTSAQTTDFWALVERGTPQEVQSALDKGADVNARGYEDWTPLMDACFSQNYGVIAILIKAGAEINARDVHGQTALSQAVMYYEIPDKIIELLDAGADVKMRDEKGKTAFDLAQENWRFKGTEAYRRLQEASQ